MNITDSNLVPVTAQPKPGQRVIQIASGKWIPVGLGGITPSGSSNSTSQFLAIEAGYINAEGNFQPLSFNDTQASDSGSAVTGLQHKIFNTGHDEPDYGGSGDSGRAAMDFYKCASVDTVNQTWTGYKAVLNSGVYSFESTATTGLTYSAITPEVESIYSADAKVAVDYMNVNIPEPYVYIPLSTDYNGIVNGQTADFFSGATGTLSFDGGRLKFNGGYLILTNITTDLLQGDFTIYFKINQTGTSRTAYIAADTDYYIGIDDYNGSYNLWAGGGSSWNILQADYSEQASSGNGSITRGYQSDTSLVYVHEGDFWRLYVNGKLSVEKERTGTIGTGKTLRLGIWGTAGDGFYGKMWDFRLYQSALSRNQIKTLNA